MFTQMTFKDEDALTSYIHSGEAASITGFPSEIVDAWRTKETVMVKTPRSEFGAVVQSWITVNRVPPASFSEPLQKVQDGEENNVIAEAIVWTDNKNRARFNWRLKLAMFFLGLAKKLSTPKLIKET